MSRRQEQFSGTTEVREVMVRSYPARLATVTGDGETWSASREGRLMLVLLPDHLVHLIAHGDGPDAAIAVDRLFGTLHLPEASSVATP